MTTCFGHRMTILRSIRAIIYMFLLCIDVNVNNSSYRPEDGHTMTETCSHKDIL